MFLDNLSCLFCDLWQFQACDFTVLIDSYLPCSATGFLQYHEILQKNRRITTAPNITSRLAPSKMLVFPATNSTVDLSGQTTGNLWHHKHSSEDKTHGWMQQKNVSLQSWHWGFGCHGTVQTTDDWTFSSQTASRNRCILNVHWICSVLTCIRWTDYNSNKGRFVSLFANC